MSAKTGFSIKALDTYEWPVDVRVPVIDAETGDGTYEIRRFTGKFKHVSVTEGKAIMDRLSSQLDQDTKAMTTASDAASAAFGASMMATHYEIELYAEIWVGWGEDLTDENGAPLPYSDELKRKLLEEAIIRNAVKEAHQKALGGEAVRRKN